MSPRPTPDYDPDGIRLQKLLSTAGVASRRASEQLIVDGRVTVNGAVVRTLGARAAVTDDIRVDGRRVRLGASPRYILLYKPRGYVTTRHDPEGRPTVLDLLDRRVGYVYPVGRLDYDSEGLLLLTSDGDLAERLMHPRHEVPKVYEAIVLGTPDPVAITKLRAGVFIDGHRTAPADVTSEATVRGARPTTRLTITLREGRNRQVRKMCQVVGLPVRDLRRVRIGSLGIGQLRPGEYRDLAPSEVRVLQGEAAAAQSQSRKTPTRGAARPDSRPPAHREPAQAWDKPPTLRHRDTRPTFGGDSTRERAVPGAKRPSGRPGGSVRGTGVRPQTSEGTARPSAPRRTETRPGSPGRSPSGRPRPASGTTGRTTGRTPR